MTDRIRQLFDQYLSGSLNHDEWEEMLDYFQHHGFPDELDATMLNEFMKHSEWAEMDVLAASVERQLRSALKRSTRDQNQKPIIKKPAIKKLAIKKPAVKRLRKWVAMSAASVSAAFLLWAGWYAVDVLGSGAAPVFDDQKWVQNELEIVPAGNRASLKLSDGRVIELDESQYGIVVDGQEVRYQDGSSTLVALEQDAPVETITLSTPRGGTYNITLSDGTQVWLNAATTLTYPSRFTEHERVVHLEGEAYFDVSELKGSYGARPFLVESATQRIEVLGTEFNVSAYADEAVVRTTLVEGSVRVYTIAARAAGSSATASASGADVVGTGLLLKPGEQSRTDGQSFSKASVKVRDYTDWKHGEFVFRNETTRQVLKRLGRWYDVGLGDLSPRSLDERFSGSISRYGEIQTVLDIMSEAAGLRFRLEDRTVHAQ